MSTTTYVFTYIMTLISTITYVKVLLMSTHDVTCSWGKAKIFIWYPLLSGAVKKGDFMTYANSKDPDKPAHLHTTLLERLFICIFYNIRSTHLLKVDQPQCTCTFWHVPKEDSSQSAHLSSQISLYCPHETLHPWISKVCRVKILIRLRECAK